MIRGFEVCKDCPYNVRLPERSTAGSAGYDFFAPYPFTVKPGETVKVETWVKAKMPRGEYLKIYARSSWGVKRHMEMGYSGIIDSDYYGNPGNDGNVTLAIHNFGTEVQEVEKGERICQGIFMSYLTVDDDYAVETRSGGFGSTGK